jgi:hypothetical protein
VQLVRAATVNTRYWVFDLPEKPIAGAKDPPKDGKSSSIFVPPDKPPQVAKAPTPIQTLTHCVKVQRKANQTSAFKYYEVQNSCDEFLNLAVCYTSSSIDPFYRCGGKGPGGSSDTGGYGVPPRGTREIPGGREEHISSLRYIACSTNGRPNPGWSTGQAIAECVPR